jgi:hypothetical protein
VKRLVIALGLVVAMTAQAAPAAAYEWKTYPWTGASAYTRSLWVEHAKRMRFRVSYRKTSGRACKVTVLVSRKNHLPYSKKMTPVYSKSIIRTATITLGSPSSGGARFTFAIVTNGNCRTQLAVRR